MSEQNHRQVWEVKARNVTARLVLSDEEYAELGRSAGEAGVSWQRRGEAEALRRLNDGRLRALFGDVSIEYKGTEERAFPPPDTETRKQIGCMLNLTTGEAAAVLGYLQPVRDEEAELGQVYRRILKLQQAEQ